MHGIILPPPAPEFEWRSTPAGPALVCTPLESIAPHFFTARAWQLGSDRSTPATDPQRREHESQRGPDAAWAQVAEAAGVGPEDLARLTQVHGRTAVAAERGVCPNADIVLTDDRRMALAVQSADCVPLLFADVNRGVVAAAHAGWRGMAARVPAAAMSSLRDRFGSRSGDLAVAVGPSIGACCYEVGEDVRRAFREAGFGDAQIARWFLDHPAPTRANASMPSLSLHHDGHHWLFDGWQSIRDQLHDCGVSPDRIWFAGLCTASHPSAFCSYRRDGSGAGRLAAVIRPSTRRA